MLRYYMTPETRQSLIAESNRLIAMRAIANAARGRRAPAADPALAANDADADDSDWSTTVSESAFARLVADLEATSQAPASADRAA